MNVIFRFKIYENIVLNEYKELYQLEHFKSKYTYQFKKLTYNEDRKRQQLCYLMYLSTSFLAKLLKPKTSITIAPNTYLYHCGSLSRFS